MDKLDAMRAFTKVVTLGSFAEAARALGTTRSAVSKAVAELEMLLGARLLNRTTRKVSPTESGLAYFERSVDVLAAIEETELQVARLHDQPRGSLKINAPTSFGILHMGAAILDFMTIYRELKIELTLNDRFIDPIEEGVDVTIRIAQLADSSLIARKLAIARRVTVAAPSYLAAAGAPQTPEDLANHRCLHYGHTATLPRWSFIKDGREITVLVNSMFCSNNGDILRRAALGGQGIAILPTFLVGPDIAAGNLATILPDYPLSDMGIYAIYAPNKFLSAKTRLFIDFLSRRFSADPEWDAFS